MTPVAARQTVLAFPASTPHARQPQNVRAARSREVRRLIAWGVLLGACAVCLLLGYVRVRLMVVESGYRLSVTRQLVVGLERAGRELELKAAAADSTGHLEALAEQRLGMRRPGRGEEELLP